MEIEIGDIPIPSDVLDVIVQHSTPRDALALYIANNYWHQRLRPVFEDRIVVTARMNHVEEKFRYVCEIHRGRAKELRLETDLSETEFESFPCLNVNRSCVGYFNTMGDTKRLMQQIRDILTKNEDQLDVSEVDPLFDCTVEIGSADSKVYYTVDHGDDGIRIGAHKGKRILELIKQADFVRRSALNKTDLQIKLKQYNHRQFLLYKNRIYITPQGDVFMKIKSSVGREDVTLKIDTDLYAQLIEIIEYNDNRDDLLKAKNIDKDDVQSLFQAELTCGGSKYYVQECMLYPDNPDVLTNGYTTDAAKRIVQLLLTHLFPPEFDECLTLNVNRRVELPKPQSLFYELARRAPYPTGIAPYLLVDTMGVSIECSGTRKFIDFRLQRHANIPRKELIDLLQAIAAKGAQKDSEVHLYCMDAYMDDQHVQREKPVMDVLIDSLYCIAYYVPKLEKSIIDRLWTLLKTHGYLDFIYK